MSGTTPPASGAWIDYSITPDASSTFHSAPSYGRYINNGCLSWSTANVSSYGLTVTPSGSFSDQTCNVARPLACCNAVPKVQFAGFTSANATMAGRPAMHAACSSEFPGSHMCHASEYTRSVSPTTPPATGAWIDYSINNTSGNATFHSAPSFGRYLNNGCLSWSTTNVSSYGLTVTPTGAFSDQTCNQQKPIACCL